MIRPTLLDLQRRAELAPPEWDLLVSWGPRPREDVDTLVVSEPRRLVMVGRRVRRG